MGNDKNGNKNAYDIIFKTKAKRRRNLEENLSKEAHRLQKVAEKSLEAEDIKKYDNVKTKLDKISFVRPRGA